MPGGDSDYRFEYRDLAEALYLALVDDAFYITLERHSEGREAMLRYLDYSMIEAREYGELYIPDAHRHGVSIWSKPLDAQREAEMKQAKQQFLLNHMGEASERKYQDIVASMAERTDTQVDNRYWYLSIVGIKPDQQGKGLGPALVNSVLDQTDRLGVPTFLETFTPRNHSFYQRLGYRVAGTFDEPVTGGSYAVMTREPVA